MAVVLMSNREFSRLDVLLDLRAGRISADDAGAMMGLRRRQVFRLLAGFRKDGAKSLVSRRRGMPGNNRLPMEVRDLVMAIVKDRYADFGPTLAAEKLSSSMATGCLASALSKPNRRSIILSLRELILNAMASLLHFTLTSTLPSASTRPTPQVATA